MASNMTSDDLDAEFLTCQICLMRYQDPKILPCLHTFCRECLKGWAKQQQLKCPTCRVRVKLPEQGVDGLRTNFFVNKLLDFVADKKGAEPSLSCQVCEGNVGGPRSWCADCAILMCDSCTLLHRKFPSSKDHEVTTCTEETLKAKEDKVSDIASKLWALDHNRPKRGVEYDISPYDGSLFSFVRWRKLQRIPTYKAFLNLLDNYKADVNQPEDLTEKEQNDARAFLNRCLDTEVMEEAHSFLAKKGYAPKSSKGFKEMLYEMWFTPHTRTYSKRARLSSRSSAFEYTFVGETRSGHVVGLHNWLRLCDQERWGNIQHRDFWCCDCDDRIILTIDLDWKGKSKTRDSFFVGTSPEFELALYTVCFLAGDGAGTEVVFGGERVTIATYKLNGHIGSCYPILEQQDQSGTDTEYDSDSEQQDWSDTDTDTESDTEDNSNNNLLAEGLDFLEYLEDRNIGPEMGKRRLKGIYEEEYTESCGRRTRTPFSQVLFALKRDDKVEVSTNHHGVDIVTILE